MPANGGWWVRTEEEIVHVDEEGNELHTRDKATRGHKPVMIQRYEWQDNNRYYFTKENGKMVLKDEVKELEKIVPTDEGTKL